MLKKEIYMKPVWKGRKWKEIKITLRENLGMREK